MSSTFSSQMCSVALCNSRCTLIVIPIALRNNTFRIVINLKWMVGGQVNPISISIIINKNNNNNCHYY